MIHTVCLLYLLLCNGRPSLSWPLVGIEIEASRVHATMDSAKVSSYMWKVTLSRWLHFRELASERNNSSP